jgi:autophagy-related protein 9
MASNVFSRLVPTTQGRSFYEELRRRDDDAEDQACLLDEENLNHDFHDYDLGHAEGLGAEESRATLGDVTGPASRGRRHQGDQHPKDDRSAWVPQEDEGDNDVPASLLVERHEQDTEVTPGRSRRSKRGHHAAAIPGPSKACPQWEAVQAEQKLHNDRVFGQPQHGNALPNSLFTGVVLGNAKKKAEWRWANISNLDNFMKDVYDYYLGNGMWCILVERALHLV